MSCQAQSMSGLTSHWPFLETTAWPVHRRLEQRDHPGRYREGISSAISAAGAFFGE